MNGKNFAVGDDRKVVKFFIEDQWERGFEIVERGANNEIVWKHLKNKSKET